MTAAHFYTYISEKLQLWVTMEGWALFQYKDSGGRLNKKDGLTRYGDSYVKDKTS